MCSSRKNPYPPQGRSSGIPRGRGVFETKILETKYEVKLEFPGGRREAINKKPSLGGVWIYLLELHNTPMGRGMNINQNHAIWNKTGDKIKLHCLQILLAEHFFSGKSLNMYGVVSN